MKYPEYYNKVEEIVMYDPLSEFLGSFEKGIISYDYKSIVAAAGHSCPTVAGAYLMTIKAIKELYKSEIPVRGDIKVSFNESIDDGVAGVIANVISNITGATKISGFKGIAGKFVRHGLMNFNSPIQSSARFSRIDNGKTVDVYYNPSSIDANPMMGQLMQKIIMEEASIEEKNSFAKMWQERVKLILIDHSNNSEVIRVELIP